MKKNHSFTEVVPAAVPIVFFHTMRPWNNKSSRLILRLGSVFLLVCCLWLIALLWLLSLPPTAQAARLPFSQGVSNPINIDSENSCSTSLNTCAPLQPAAKKAGLLAAPPLQIIEPVVDFSRATYSVNEGATTVTITATLSVTSSDVVSVEYATADNTAAADSDYSSVTSMLTFPPLVTQTTFTVPITDDNLYEAAEIFQIMLSNPISATLSGAANNPTSVIIIDNDPDQQPSIEFADASYSVNEPAGTATITVTLSNVSGATTEATVTLSGNTATAGVDYVDTSGPLSFKPGDTEITFNISITDDAEFEGDETLTMTLSDPISATLGATNPVQLTIIDDEFLPTVDFSAVNYAVDENVGSNQAVITVTLSDTFTEPVSIDYESIDNTATAGSDYTAIADTLTFPVNTTLLTITVPISDDANLEGVESLTLLLTNPVSGTLIGATNNPAALSILDDEAPTADFSSPTYSVDEGVGTATITVTLSETSTEDVGLDYLVGGGTATPGSDFDTTGDTLTFTTNITEQTFTVAITDDLFFESDETIVLTLLNPNRVNIGS
ncbi:MAG TPA: Calx-beta domain-containing protein, partial [Anaerolineae bacterium]|nr:Calx-beta domain-containing protein [Anaerolineae bacterium]